jgi:catechol 2,3-dioxygenase-like lactoylglutathione lyase family enzyme
MKFAHIVTAGLLAIGAVQAQPVGQAAPQPQASLGNFSVSLAVRNIEASKTFYEKLGFVQVSGNLAQKWVIMKNGSTKIGLFQGMFERNALTFNPGWDENGGNLATFEDVRLIQRRFKAAGLQVGTDIATTSGPAYFALTDPDGNPVLIDQHR